MLQLRATICTICTAVLTVPVTALPTVTATGKCCSEGDCDKGCTIGASITGIANFTTITDEDVKVIRQALVDHKVIRFPGMAHLFDPDSQLEFAKRLGSVYPTISKVPDYVEKGVHQSVHSVRHKDERHGKAAGSSVNTMVEANKPGKKVWKGKEMPQGVARLVREPGDPFAFGEGYHADTTFFPEPPFFTFLVARELPGGEDDTNFIDVEKAYQTLSPELKQEIQGMVAYHNDSAGKVYSHPMIRTHPESGKNVIYVNSHFTHKVVGYDDVEGKALLDKVFDHIESQPIFKLKWTCDVEKYSTTHPDCLHAVIWDNRQLQHTATTPWALNPKYNKYRRELHRVTISGDQAPYYRPMPKKTLEGKTEL